MRLLSDRLSPTTITHPSNAHTHQTNSLSASFIYQEDTHPPDSMPNQSTATLPVSPQSWTPFRKLSRNSPGKTSTRLTNPSSLTIPSSLHIKNNSHSHSSSIRKSSYSSSVFEHQTLSRSIAPSRNTPIPGLRSSSALSNLSFRSLRSINSRIKVRLQSLAQTTEPRSSKPELDWSSFRSEYELHLARGSIIERCLVEVDLGPTVTERGRSWIDAVWNLADRLSPPLPAALVQYSAAGLLPLLNPLRQTLHYLALELPYNHMDDTEDFEKFESLVIILQRAIWLAKLIENVIEIVSQIGLVKFELIGTSNKSIINNNQDEFIDREKLEDQYLESIHQISKWNGLLKGRSGSGQPWRGSIKVT